MEVTLRGLRYHPDMTEETPCFSASLYIDGKRRGTVSNNGQGGAHRFGEWTAQRELDEWGKKQTPPVDAEEVVSARLDEMLLAKDRKDTAKRLMRRMRPEARRKQQHAPAGAAVLIVVGFRLDAKELTAVGKYAGSRVVEKAKQVLAQRDGATAFDVFNCEGALIESTGELRRAS